jgi:hypothetical protein
MLIYKPIDQTPPLSNRQLYPIWHYTFPATTLWANEGKDQAASPFLNMRNQCKIAPPMRRLHE